MLRKLISFFTSLFVSKSSKSLMLTDPIHDDIRRIFSQEALHQTLSTEQREAKILELLSQQPCRQVWEEMLDILEHWEGEGFTAILQLIREHISGKEHLYLFSVFTESTAVPGHFLWPYFNYTVVLHFLNSWDSFEYLYSYLRKQLNCYVSVVESQEWGEIWWDVEYKGVRLTFHILLPGTELYSNSNEEDKSEEQILLEQQVIYDVAEQIAFDYNKKCKVIENELSSLERPELQQFSDELEDALYM